MLRVLLSIPSSHDPPSHRHHGDGTREHPNADTVAEMVARAVLRLIDLWTDDTCKLCACIGDTYAQTRSRSALCRSDSLRPHQRVYARNTCCGQGDKDVLDHWSLDCEQNDIAGTDDHLEPNAYRPGSQCPTVDKPTEEAHEQTSEGVCWHCHQLTYSGTFNAELVDDGGQDELYSPAANAVEYPEQVECVECRIGDQTAYLAKLPRSSGAFRLTRGQIRL